MMDCIVAKFGGTSMADAGQFRKVRQIIEADRRRRYIVVSAPGKRFPGDTKITDLLYMAVRKRIYPIGVEKRLCEIRDILGVSYPVEERLTAMWKHFLHTGEAGALIGSGEYLCGGILSAYLGIPFVDARRVITIHADGRADDTRCYTRLKRVLSAHERAVIPGFYGQGSGGKTQLFSRGGSDISGALVACAVEACCYENWTDVSGFFNADPRLFPDARPIFSMSYRKMRQLSHLGATVLHEDAVFPVLHAGIPIHVCNTNKPDEPGTWIGALDAGECGNGKEEKREAVTACGGYVCLDTDGWTPNQRNACFVHAEHIVWQDNTRQILVIKEDKLCKIKSNCVADKEFGSAIVPLTLLGIISREHSAMCAAIEQLSRSGIEILFGDGGLAGDAGFVLGIHPQDTEKAVRALLTNKKNEG